ncbi:DEAD/DEAH box helicase [Lichenihabitans sp. Uapishka_5]|uniref:DEAD/DEAH box helicase n=1 Tax=Lichenihabitans sp. Uapishka_5 TaxID=3037302 RepID=UPI0029E7E53A|nr:DEAD/DEAH box helicase [Lichenihabitans sp. Uapishka_5]MDX7950871.1 DEAD/DEAH box helicase [Lichenihabitans sp. Uapishka_5]
MPFPTLSAPLADALAERGYAEPTGVQSAVLDPALAGRDLLVSAQTGSGKTIAFGLAIHDGLLGTRERFEAAAEPLALIVAPTRELALQVQRELEWLYAKTGAVVTSCVGGMDPRREARALDTGAHIVVGTPGRLRDHLERGRLKLDNLKAVVLDEADEMLDMGFREDLEVLLDATPSDRRTLLFSATLPKGIAHLASRYQRNAQRIAVAGAVGGHADIEYRAVRVQGHEIEHAVVNLLRYMDTPSAIVFCNTRESVRHLHAGLLERGFSAVALSGELSQSERNHALQALRDKRARVCIATDVAARGIDLPNLGLVIHAELPNDAEALQHRSGRTGRAGRKGTSVLLVPRQRLRKAEGLLAAAGVQTTWSGPPTVEEIRVLDQQRLLADPLLTEAAAEEDAELVAELTRERSAADLAAALLKLYRSNLPVVEDVSDPGYRSDTRSPRPDRPERGERGASGPREGGDGGSGVWFRLDTGRANNADPRRLLPMLCRRGDITRQDIGAIRIFDRETKVEIHPDKAAHFAEAVRRTNGAGAVAIDRVAEAPGPARRDAKAGVEPRKPRKPHKPRTGSAH